MRTRGNKQISPEEAYDACDYFTDDVASPGVVLGKLLGYIWIIFKSSIVVKIMQIYARNF